MLLIFYRANWVVEGWNSLSEDLIRKSFVITGQSITSKPENISCLQQGKSAHAVLEKVYDLWDKGIEDLANIEIIDEPDESQDKINDPINDIGMEDEDTLVQIQEEEEDDEEEENN